MQQVVYEILYKGHGNLTDTGHKHMYAASPWIESVDSVSMNEAPLLGEKKMRLIKTHMPVQLCPYSEAAKYIYVTRHPVACFGSIVDYFQLMSGPLAPAVPTLLDWYCSDSMWWLSWPDHVAGWWNWKEKKPNVLFFHFEEMKKNLEGTVRKVAQFLGVELAEEQIEKVVYKSGFEYMKDNEDFFEMSPPNLFSVSGTYFKSGQIDRKVNLTDAQKNRILVFCKQRLAGSGYPVENFYPDIAKVQ
jgi:aryl sulfotransferase